ncbi:MAG TPA: cysteine synthase A [Candidatus Limiplasma stercoravium]|nr:cysteine synthase A [Candidatus Limiplasma stercoravium]
MVHSVSELIGRTPLMSLERLGQALSLKARLAAKLEMFNPAGSAKDRVAMSLLDDAQARGLIGPGATIVEPTSGNTGIGLACLASARGYQVILTMPDTMSAERQRLLKAYGAKVVLTPGGEGMAGAIRRAEELAASIPGSFMPRQFDNPANPQAHRLSTGPEIWEDTQGQVDVFVASVGTGGTLTGVGEALKARKPQVRVVAVEPADSPVLSGGKPGPHKLQGIGAGFVPGVLNTSLYDEVIAVTTEQAYAAVRDLARLEGLLCGISSGAALCASVALARRPQNAGKLIVTLFPDSGERYLSTPDLWP